jgi:hypothetical protein
VRAFERSAFTLSILTRTDSSATFPSSIRVIRADYTSLDSLTHAFTGQDVVISLIGSGVVAAQTLLIDAAIAAGVRRFIPSEFGSRTTDARARAIVPVFESKFAVIEYLRAREASIEWTGIATGPFFDWGHKVGFLGLDAASRTATLYDGAETVFSATNLGQVGETTVRVLELADETRNRFVTVSGFQTTQREVLKVAEKITGEKWTVQHVDSKEHVKKGAEQIAKGDFSGIAKQLQGLTFGDHGLGNIESEGLWNETLGLKQESIEDSLKAAFAGKLLHEV